jgi:hypothetical protein
MKFSLKTVTAGALVCIVTFTSSLVAQTSKLSAEEELAAVRKEVQALREENQTLRRLLATLSPASVPITPSTATVSQPVAPATAAAETGFWMSSTGKRHNSKCRFYKNTQGYPCGPNDGIACKLCGG